MIFRMTYLKELVLSFSMIFFICTTSSNAETITASGCSVSNVGYLSELAKEYKRRTGINVFVRGGGSMLGIEDIKNKRVDFAASCRNRLPGDPEDIEFIKVAWDALVVIVHRSNPLNNISLNDVRDIFFAKITNWKQLNSKDAPIQLIISRPTIQGLSGVEASTKTMILNGKDPVVTPNVSFIASTAIVEQLIEKTPNGFAISGFSSARKRDVKMLKVNGISPTKENIINGMYPLKRPLFLVVPKTPKPEVRRFLDFVLSKEGQNFISSLGAVSLKDIR